MVERSIVARLRAEVADYKSKMRDAQQATRAVGEQAKQSSQAAAGSFRALARSLNNQQAQWNELNRVAMRGGAVMVAGVAAVTKAAMGWESAWAGVTKTVNGSQTELAALEGELRAMARTMPQSHADIAAVAEAAGQLGVKTQDVAEFSRVMLQLGDTTNLTSDEAATSLAQFMNVMGTAGDQVSRLGATLVALGNDGASTERDIVQMGQRIAGAGKQVGLTEQDVLAFANALASVGIEAEAGGTAISQSFIKIDKSVREGGEKLDLLAKTAGMTSAEFRQAWEIDAAGALNTFIQGLGRVQQSGGDTFAVLESLGITGIRQTDAILRLAGANDLLADSLDLSKEAWQDNTALAIEAAKRYETAESQIKIAWNSIRDSAIDAGQSMLPMVKELAGGVADLTEQFSNLPPSMQGAITQSAAFAGVGLLAAGGLVRLATSAGNVIEAWKTIQTQSPGVASGLTKAGKAAGIAAAAFAALKIIATIESMLDDFNPTVSDAAAVLARLADQSEGAAASLDQTFKIEHGWGPMKAELEGIGTALDALKDPELQGDKWINDIFGGVSLIGKVEQQFSALDDALVAMAQNGSLDLAQESFTQLAAQVVASGHSVEEILPYFDDYKQTLVDQAWALEEYDLKAEDYAAWMQGKIPAAIQTKIDAVNNDVNATDKQKQAADDASGSIADLGDSAEDAAEQIDDLADSLFDAAGGAIDSDKALLHYKNTLADVKKEAKENGEATDTNTQKGRDNREALIELAESQQKYIESLVRNGEETEKVRQKTRTAREQFIDVAKQMGWGQKEAEKLADKYGLIPSDVETMIKASGYADAVDKIEDIIRRVKQADGTTATLHYKTDVNGQVVGDVTRTASGSRTATTRATGGVLPGWSPGRDIHRFWSPTAGRLDLGGGESVMVPEFTRAAGGARGIDALNRAAEQGRDLGGFLGGYAGGGLLTIQFPRVGDALKQMATEAQSYADEQARKSGRQQADKALTQQGGSAVPLGSSGLVSWHGGTFTENFAKHLAMAYAKAAFGVMQGGWNAGRVAASGTSHDGDAVDVSPSSGAVLAALRSSGVASWIRTPAQGFVYHIHGVPLPGAGRGSASATWQAQDYLRGGDGLQTGGWVTGPAGPDQVWKRLTAGEFVNNVRSSQRYGPLLEFMNAEGLAGGGSVKAAEFGTAAGYSVATIVALIRAIESPVKNLTSATQSLRNATAANATAQRNLRAPREVLAEATRRQRTAVDQRDNIRATNAQELKQAKDVVAARRQTYDLAVKQLAATKASSKAERDAVITARQKDVDTAKRRLDNARDSKASRSTIAARQKEYDVAKQELATTRRTISAGKDAAAVKRAQQAVTRADEQLDKARAKQAKVSRDNTNELAQANKRVTDTTKEKQRAQDAYNKVSDTAKAKTQALKEAQEELARVQQQIADQARQVSDAFTDAYLSKSTAVADWLQAMTIGTQDITTLTDRVTRLRRLGLSETLISQIMSMAQSQGAPAGTAIAQAIITGGSKTIDQLNKAAQSLQDAGDILGYKQAIAPSRGYASGIYSATEGWHPTAEAGAELVVNPAWKHYGGGERVFTAAETKQLLAGGGGISESALISAVAAIVDSRPVISGNQIGYDPAEITRDLDRQRSGKLHAAGIGVFR